MALYKIVCLVAIAFVEYAIIQHYTVICCYCQIAILPVDRLITDCMVVIVSILQCFDKLQSHSNCSVFFYKENQAFV